MYLGPVVVAQQVLDPPHQTAYPWKDKKGGHICFSQVFRSLILGSRHWLLPQDVMAKVSYLSFVYFTV